MNAYELANILLQGKDIPVVIPALNSVNKANSVEEISLFQNIDSPFEYCLLLSNDDLKSINEIEISD